MRLVTVLGASGFIGSHLVARLQELEIEHVAVARNDEIPDKHLGHLIYCIGLTADFRSRPLETVEAHVCHLLGVLRTCTFDSLLYLSSTRLYRAAMIAKEDQDITINPANPSDLYNISKALGESMLLSSEPRARVARLSSVYGPDWGSENFLTSIVRAAVDQKRVVLQSSFDSEKDYINVTDAVDILIKIALSGQDRIYNVASGVNVSHRELAERLGNLTGATFEVAANAPRVAFPPISVERISREFQFQAASVIEDLEILVQAYRAQQ
jgi:nucleoside-diphosphate-sugar epimerase